MDRTQPMTKRSWIALAVAVFVLNSGLTLQNVWPTAWVTLRGVQLSIERGPRSSGRSGASRGAP